MISLSLYETRVLGCLLEKERTTPDQYPLSLNAIIQACNQKTNREPVLQLSEEETKETITQLIEKGFLCEVVIGSRVTKYKQRFGNTEFSEFKFTNKELSLLCVLFLRGPQTTGELRTRTQRLCDFADLTQLELCLQELANREPSPYVIQLEREPGKRESRFAHLFSGAITSSNATVSSSGLSTQESTNTNKTPIEKPPETLVIAQLKEKVGNLESRLEELHAEVQEMKKLWD